MRKIKNIMLKVMTTAVVCGTLFMCAGTTSHATGNTYDTAVEAAYGDTFKSVYNEKLAGSPLEAECANGVDTTNGHLILSRNDLYLEGTGGMDFELNRYYDSNEAIIGNPTVEAVDELKVDTVKVHYMTHDGEAKELTVNTALIKKHKKALKDMLVTYTKGDPVRKNETVENTQRTRILSNQEFNVYGLASGWKFDLPWIETITIQEETKNSWSARPAYLHFGSKGTLGIETTPDEANKCYRIAGLAGYDYSDVKLEDWNKEVDGIQCKYLLRDKTGLRTYFNEDGVVVMQKDNHNNTIIYTYEDKIYLKQVTDSVGRVVNFNYEVGEDLKQLTSVTVEGKEVEGGVSKKTIKYTYDERSYTPLNSDTISGLVLKSATVDGSKETYGYRIVERLMSTAGEGIASQRVSTNESYLLKKVTANGSIQHYEYRANVVRGTKDEETGQTRDVTVQGYYVTREYTEDVKTGKKSDGLKYDFFQKQNNKLIRFCDFSELKNEIWQYGRTGLRTVAVVSKFNPNKYKTNGKMSDYTYKVSAINEDTLRLEENTKKNVSIYIYNSQKMLTDEVNYGKEKEVNLYSYDNDDKGSLVVLQTNKTHGSKGSGSVTSKQGYSYDVYRNVLTSKSPKAYLKKNSGKEALFTTTYTYHGTESGYPVEDKQFSLCTVVSQEQSISEKTKYRLTSALTSNGIDYSSILEQRSVNGGAYTTISKIDFNYDSQGNETQGKVYPSYSTDDEKEVIQNDYTFNSLGQQTKTTVTITSAKNPADNRSYVENQIVYDSFGNKLQVTDENGLTSKMSYNPETEEEAEIVNSVGTEYETTDKEYVSSDSLKSMTVDEYGRVSIEMQDSFGNTILSKDEASGTWTESTYDYGSSEGESIEEDTELEIEENARLLEEKVYTFNPDEKRFIINEDGETVPNFYITGKSKDVLSGTKYFYDDLGNEIGSASFSNGEFDSAHCTSFSFYKDEIEVIGEEDDAQTISTSYSKEINPTSYSAEVNVDNYYNQFNDSVLSETIIETVSDAEENVISEKSIYIRGENKEESVITYENDSFGRTTKENTTTRKYQDGKWLPAYETEMQYTYDDNGNVIQTENKSRKEGETEWEVQTTKATYDEKGQIITSYTPRGVEENVATKYTYDILGRKIKEELPQEKKDGSTSYQTVTSEYDTIGNLIAEEEQIDDDKVGRTEYTYDEHGNLVMVKCCMENDAAQYVQYVYDEQGNKVRQFTGMTSPLTLSVSETETISEGSDTFTYGRKNYVISIEGKKKSDTISETKYEYDGKNRLVSYTDPEGRTETYTYDINSNLIKTVDKNGNVLKNTYDYQNRLTEAVAEEKKTGKETTHTYTYNAYGDVETQDDISFVYDDVSGQVTKETTKLTKNKKIVKSYSYDSAGNKSLFKVTVGDDTKLSLTYDYDGESKLTSVKDADGNEVVGYEYDANGSLTKRSVAEANLTTNYSYDYQNRLLELTNQANGEIVSSYQSEYLVNGKKSKETSTVLNKDGNNSKKTATYTYDLLGRITKETKTGSEDISYTYDSHNNRKEMTVGNETTAYRYNRNDELLRTDTLNTETEENEVVIYKNDKNGNQLAAVNRYEIPSGTKDESYIDVDVTLGDNRLNDNVVNHYNALNQLTKTLTKNYKVSYTYDAEGLRTSKTVNGEKTVFVWDGDQVVMELSKGGKVQKRYIRGNDLVYADKGEDNASSEAYEKTYYVTDSHGNVVQLLDEKGSVTKTYEYDSFGNEVNPDNKDDNPFRYCGEYYDKETGEIYLRARYYQPAVGRFITRDSYTGESDDPLSLHLYTYCENDGVNHIDPSGHAIETVVDIGSVVYSLYALGKDPSWENAGWLALDVGGAVIPFVPSGSTFKGGKAAFKALKNSNLSVKISNGITKGKRKFGAVVEFGKKHFDNLKKAVSRGKEIPGKIKGKISKAIDKVKQSKLFQRFSKESKKPNSSKGSKKNSLPAPPVRHGFDTTRINIAKGPTRFSPSKNAGLQHVINRHFSPGRNAGQFTISVDKLKSILKRKDIINTLGVPSTTSGQYTRIVNVGEVVGIIKPSIPKVGGKPTKWLTIITDVKGNLITTYPCPAP